MECKESYCEDCARLIPDHPQRRMRQTKKAAELDENELHWIYNLGVDDYIPMQLKLQKIPWHRNVTFDRCYDDGCEYQTYPYDTDKYCDAITEDWPLNLHKPTRKRDPMNDRRVLTPLQRNAPETPSRPNPDNRHPWQKKQDRQMEEKQGQKRRWGPKHAHRDR